MDWDLFIDESGKFGDLDQTVAVAGVLVQRSNSAPADARVREVFREAHPWAPLPHHAADLDLVTGQVAAWAHAGRPTEGELLGVNAPRSVEALRVLEGVARRAKHPDPTRNSLLQDYVAKLGTARWPRSDEIHAASVAVRSSLDGDGDRQAFGLVKGIGQAYFCRLRTRLERLVDSSSGHIRLVAAAEGKDAIPFKRPGSLTDLGHPFFQDRYLCSLEVLIERVVLLLRHEEAATDRLSIHVSYRDLEDAGQRAPLTDDHVNRTLWRAQTLKWKGRSWGPEVALGSIEQYGLEASPWFAVADFVSGRVNREFKLGPGEWTTLASRLRREVRVDPEVRSRFLERSCPGIAASGAARRAVRAAFGGDAETPEEKLRAAIPGWARDQARTLCLAVAKKLGGRP